MDLDAAKHNLYEQFARIGRAVSSPSRLELLDLIAQGAKPVEMLARLEGGCGRGAMNRGRRARGAVILLSGVLIAWHMPEILGPPRP